MGMRVRIIRRVDGKKYDFSGLVFRGEILSVFLCRGSGKLFKL